MIRFLPEPFFEDGHRLVDLAQRAMGQRQQASRIGMLRPQGDDPTETGDGFGGPVLAVQQDAEVRVGVGMSGIREDGGAIRRFRFGHVPLGFQQDAKVAVGIGVIRIDRNRVAARRDCIIQSEKIPEDDGKVAVPVGLVRRKLETPFNQPERVFAATFLVGQDAGKVQCVRMVGNGFEDLAVNGMRRYPLVILLKANSDRDRFVQGNSGFQSPFLEGLEVVLEMQRGVQRAILLLRLVFQIDLGKLERNMFSGGPGIRTTT